MLVLMVIFFLFGRAAGDILSDDVLNACPACSSNGALASTRSALPSCVLSNCILLQKKNNSTLSLENLRRWLPENIQVPSADAFPVLLSNVTLQLPTCKPIWNLQEDACTLRVSAFWPQAGLETGRGYIFFPLLSTPFGSATARNLNVTCPLDSWTDLESTRQLQPCGTATVFSAQQLLAALAALQPGHQRLLITLAANISLPASPKSPPASPPSSTSIDDQNAGGPPLVVIYRNVTLVGLGGLGSPPAAATAAAVAASGVVPGGSGAGDDTVLAPRPTELNLRMWRNAFVLQQPTETSSSGTGSDSGTSDGGNNNTDASSHIVFSCVDLALVNLPPGQRTSWPLGLLATDMWHLGLDRSEDAPVQLMHMRVMLVLSTGQTRYFNYWYTRAVSLVEEERASAAWVLDVITPPVQRLLDGGASPTQCGATGTFHEKFNVSATRVPVATPPSDPPVDLWLIDEPPPVPDAISFAATGTELLRLLLAPRTDPRVIVLLKNITLDHDSWPTDGPLLSTSITLSGPALASTNSSDRPALNMGGRRVVRLPPGASCTFRNLRLLNLSVPIAWVLPEAPVSLPGRPAYSTWRARCLPHFLDISMESVKISGCDVEVPPEVFSLLRLFNSRLCSSPANATGASPNCTLPSASAVAAAGFPYLPDQLYSVFERIFRASGQVPMSQPNPDTLYLSSHTLTSIIINNSSYIRVDYPQAGNSSGAATPATSPSPPPPPPLALGPCSLQTLFALVLSAPSEGFTPVISGSGWESPAGDATGMARSAIIGVSVGVGTVVLLAAGIGACFAVRWRKPPADESRKTWRLDRGPGNLAAAPGASDGGSGAAGGAVITAVGIPAAMARDTYATAVPCRGGSGPPIPQPAILMPAGGEAGEDSCSAFSQSYAVGKMAPTMLEQVLGHPPGGARLPPGLTARAVDPAEGRGVAGVNAVTVTPCQRGRLAPTSGAGVSGGTVSGGVGDMAHLILAGEIEGMIRRYEDSSTVATPATSGGGIRQRVLGSGGFGVVYKGEWRGLPVAIKVVLLQAGDSAMRRERLVREVALSASLSHPNVVPTYHYMVQAVMSTASTTGPHNSGQRAPHPGDAAPLPPSSRARYLAPLNPNPDPAPPHEELTAYKLSIIMAYCDRGTLRDAIRAGLLNTLWPEQPSPLQQQQQLVTSQETGHLRGAEQGATTASAAPGEAATVPANKSGGNSGEGPSGGDTTPTGSSPPGTAVSAPAPPPEEGILLTSPPVQHLGETKGPVAGVQVPVEGGPVPTGKDAAADGAGAAAAGSAVPECTDVRPTQPAVQRSLRYPGLQIGLLPDCRTTWQAVRACPNTALALFAALDVARGLEYLHACSVVHGDLSLQNILITSAEPAFPDAALAASASVWTCGATSAVGPGAKAPAAGGWGMAPDRGFGGPRTPTRLSGSGADVRGSGVGCEGTQEAGRASVDAASPAAAPAITTPGTTGTTATATCTVSCETGHDMTSATWGLSASPDEPPRAPSALSGATRMRALMGVDDSSAGVSWCGGSAPCMTICGARSLSSRIKLVQPLLGQIFRISDFGLSVRLEGDETHRSGLHQGTPFYTAPEVLLSGKVSPAADVYSYGVCLWCLLHNVTLCQLRHLLPSMYCPVAPTLLVHTTTELPSGARTLLRRCLAIDPAGRPAAGTLVLELQALMQAAVGPDLVPLLFGAERRERSAGRTVMGSLLLDSEPSITIATAAGH